MKKLLSALAIVTTLSLSFWAPAAFATRMPECASGNGDTNENAQTFFHGLWPADNLFYFQGDDMYAIIAAAMIVANMPPPATDTTELWISSGPGGDGTTVFIYFQDDCYLAGANLTQEAFDAAMDMAFPGEPPAPVQLPSNPTTHKPVIPLAGARSA